jgi:hypothetical protein
MSDITKNIGLLYIVELQNNLIYKNWMRIDK